jgi:hypothetical protein
MAHFESAGDAAQLRDDGVGHEAREALANEAARELTKIDATKISDERRPEYLFKVSDEKYLYVSASKNNYSYESFKMYTGSPGDMHEVPIDKVTRYRDGGTTFIKTPEGTLYVPSVLRPDPSFGPEPTWNSKVIAKADVNQFDISESKSELSFRKKSS